MANYVNVGVYIYIYIYIYIGIHTYIHIYIYIHIHKEIPYTEKSVIKGNPLYRDVPYVYFYIYIYIYIHRESYTKQSLTKGNPLYRDILKNKSLVKGSFVKKPYKCKSLNAGNPL